jgi:DNA-binding FrmR family transcriptional regulator
MLEGDRYCVDVVQQLNAISAAVDEVALIVLQNHMEGCVSDAIREGAGEERIQELMVVLRRAVRR